MAVRQLALAVVAVLAGVCAAWIIGERDRSIPVAGTLANLERVKREINRPIEIRTMAGTDHGMRRVTGEPADFWQVIAEWLKTHGIR